MNMIEGETPVPERVSSAHDDPQCTRSRARLGRFLRGALSLADERELRGHLTRCDGCNREYRAELVRVSREQRERRAWGEAPFESEAKREKARKRSNFLRMFVPALVIVAIVVQVGPARPIGEVIAVEGTCRLGPQLLDEGDPAQAIVAGQWVVTAPDSVAQLRTRSGATLELEPSTEVFVTDREPTRYLLGAGAVQAAGSCVLTTTFGAVEVREGSVHVTLSENAVEVAVHSGAAVVSNAKVERTLAPGERVQLSIDGATGL